MGRSRPQSSPGCRRRTVPPKRLPPCRSTASPPQRSPRPAPTAHLPRTAASNRPRMCRSSSVQHEPIPFGVVVQPGTQQTPDVPLFGVSGIAQPPARRRPPSASRARGRPRRARTTNPCRTPRRSTGRRAASRRRSAWPGWGRRRARTTNPFRTRRGTTRRNPGGVGAAPPERGQDTAGGGRPPPGHIARPRRTAAAVRRTSLGQARPKRISTRGPGLPDARCAAERERGAGIRPVRGLIGRSPGPFGHRRDAERQGRCPRRGRGQRGDARRERNLLRQRDALAEGGQRGLGAVVPAGGPGPQAGGGGFGVARSALRDRPAPRSVATRHSRSTEGPGPRGPRPRRRVRPSRARLDQDSDQSPETTAFPVQPPPQAEPARPWGQPPPAGQDATMVARRAGWARRQPGSDGAAPAGPRRADRDGRHGAPSTTAATASPIPADMRGAQRASFPQPRSCRRGIGTRSAEDVRSRAACLPGRAALALRPWRG